MPEGDFFLQLLSQFGYLGIAMATFVKAFSVVLLAGGLAHQGHLWLPLVVFSAFIGTVAGDEAEFVIGRRYGPRLLARSAPLGKAAKRLHGLIHRYDILFILGFRFVYGTRIATPLLLGMEGVGHLRFFLLNCVGVFFWSLGNALVGYGMGFLYVHYVQDYLGDRPALTLGTTLAALFALFLAAAFFFRRRRRRYRQKLLEREMENEGEGEEELEGRCPSKPPRKGHDAP